MGVFLGAAVVCLILGLLVLFMGSRSRGKMKIRIGSFEGPIWFLLCVLGVFLLILDNVPVT